MKIQENVLTVIKVIVPFVFVIILFVTVGQFGFGKIVEIRDQIAGAQSEQKILTQKLDILENIQGSGAQSSVLAASALPDSNSLLSVMSQIKTLAMRQGVILNQVKAGSPTIDPAGFSTVSISFSAAGSRTQIESFISAVGSFAPISIVDKVKISESAPGVALANITIKSFWAPFPTKVPAITSAITDLTPAEQEMLQSLSKLTQPVLITTQARQGGKADPFSP